MNALQGPVVRRATSSIVFLILLVSGCRSDDSDVLWIPAAPAVGSVSAIDGTVRLAWAAVPGAESYNLYWSTTPGVTPSTGEQIEGVVGLEYVHTGLINATTYYYVLSAVSAFGEGPTSPEWTVTLPPSAIDVISVTGGDGRATVSWTVVDGALSYNVYRGTTPSFSLDAATVFVGTSPPFTDASLTNGTTYYYLVRAVGEGGESLPSSEVSVRPAITVGAPVDVTVTIAEEMPNTLVISWDPPPAESPDSYDLHWDTAPEVLIGENRISGVTSPYYHTGLVGGTTYYYVVTAITDGTESEGSVEVSGVPKGSRNDSGGGGGDEDFGNNLSFPLIFADGYGLTGLAIDGTVEPWLDTATALRPTSTEAFPSFPHFSPDTIFQLNGTDYFQQQTESTWQAEWRDGSSALQEVIIDWGDNLVSRKKLTAQSVIRVETVLYQDTSETAPQDTMTGIAMKSLFGSQRNEMQGTDTTAYETNERTVFSVLARLKIQKLDGPGGDVDPSVEGVDTAVYESFGLDGPGHYGAEVNVAGKAIYGYVWMLRTWDLSPEQKSGWWRITFSIDPSATFGDPAVTLDSNTALVALDPSDATAELDVAANESWIEVEIQ